MSLDPRILIVQIESYASVSGEADTKQANTNVRDTEIHDQMLNCLSGINKLSEREKIPLLDRLIKVINKLSTNDRSKEVFQDVLIGAEMGKQLLPDLALAVTEYLEPSFPRTPGELDKLLKQIEKYSDEQQLNILIEVAKEWAIPATSIKTDFKAIKETIQKAMADDLIAVCSNIEGGQKFLKEIADNAPRDKAVKIDAWLRARAKENNPADNNLNFNDCSLLYLPPAICAFESCEI